VQAVLIAGRRTALHLALAAFASTSQALELGPVEVLSALGERLDARIPLKAREGEWFHATCLALTRDASQPFLYALPDAALSVERRRASANLRVRTAQPVNEPALAFAVTSTCAGAAQPLAASITVLLDPPGTSRRRPGTSELPASPPGSVRRAAPQRRTTARAPAEPSPVVGAAPRLPARAGAPAAAVAAAPEGARYVLRLSSAPMDLSRTRQFDDKTRAVLRERLRLLDSDDQVAAMLSMRDNLRRLEARVAELQLKLATMPQSFPRSGVAPEPAMPSVATPAPATPPVATAPTQAAAGPRVEAAPARKPAGEEVGSVAPPPQVEGVVGALESFTGRLIALGLVILALLALLGRWLWLRSRQPPEAADEAGVARGEATVLMEPDEAPEAAQPIEVAAPVRTEMASDASLATRLDENTDALRRRYIEERFPEIRGGTILLDDPASVVKGARLFYEDGAMPRAVELLRFAVEDRPEQLKPWLALFEVYRLERLSGEYAELAARFRDRHGGTDHWAKVRGFGRELDPANPLYEVAPMTSLETIGPREARRLAASNPDPIVENWLDAPMDFENEVLATELRRSLMARAAVEERDLTPNPMPALRSVEMFSVG
jgi:Tfp pilus assembly protein FimV